MTKPTPPAPLPVAAPRTFTGTQILAIRERLGLTQREFAERVPVAYREINRWEQGHHKPSKLGMRRLAELEAEAAAAALTSRRALSRAR